MRIGFLFFFLIIAYYTGCKMDKEPIAKHFDQFRIYVNKDTSLENGIQTTVTSVGRKIEIPASLDLSDKIKILLDSISFHYFNNLPIELAKIDNSDDGLKILFINLKESSDYNGPGSVEPYKSWYDYFQGSSGGLNTTTILTRSILQKEYPGKWIDGVMFMYQGDSIGIWDHINLNGLILRKQL